MNVSRWVYVGSVVLVVVSVVAWCVTGREGYTRWPDQRLAQADAPAAAGESELLAAAGFADQHQPARPDIQSRFAFGLVPGGAAPHQVISVLTSLALATIASGAAATSKRFAGARS